MALAVTLVLLAGAAHASELVDAVVGVVDGEVITASDIALARALGLFGFSPSPDPIESADVERYARARLVLAEARRLAIDVPPDTAEDGWRAVEARAGGPSGLDAWLAAAGIDRAWARRAADTHERWRRFVDLRFVALAFVTPAEVTAALGSGADDAEARSRAHERLRETKAERALAAWLDERVAAASIRRRLAPGASVPLPFHAPAR
ncbi:MAG: hypothetical protein HYU41_05905 [Candidatus Rokubacteria bacterium]|nr:hypothetical protein [Candidatus Rokubacteria bacterium]